MNPSLINLPKPEAITCREFKQKLKKRFGKRFLSTKLFGSKARGEGKKESDLDILVLLTSVSYKDKYAIFDIATDLQWKNEVEISPLVLSKGQFEELLELERRIALDIEKEGLPI